VEHPLATPPRAALGPLIDWAAFDAEHFTTAAPIDLFRRAKADAHAELANRFRAGTEPGTLVRQRAQLIDELLRRAWQRFGLGDHRELALVAVGGYGRMELHPGSDVDLLILLGGALEPETQQQLTAFIAFLWDIKLEVGHSVRTVADCVRQAEQDITVATNLMESRLLVGPERLWREMGQQTGPAQIWPSREFFQAKWQEQLCRHHKFHDIAYNLEPNLKEGPGGMRDIQTLAWVAKRHFDASTLKDLLRHGFLNESEHDTLLREQAFLWQVRFALHLLAGRREDRLLFDYQRVLAEQFGYQDQEPNLAVEQFMQRYYRCIGELGRLNEMLLALFQEAILHAGEPVTVVPINRRFQKRFQSKNGLLEVTNDKVFERYPFALLELFLILQQDQGLKGVRAHTIRLIRNHRHLIDEKFRFDIRARSLFMEILRQPRGVATALLRMHRYGVLGAYLPAFGAVVGQMQYDLFHVYTVDEHILFVMRNLRAFASPGSDNEFPLCSELFQRLPKPELLYLAALFHDIAKGRRGDHSELGAKDAFSFCRHHGLSSYDSRLIAWLVENHLVMSTTSQRQDISDPQVINTFAARVRDWVHLDYLYLLTVADIRATNPNLWNDWKATLLRDLYESTLLALRRGLDNPILRTELVEETQQQAKLLLRIRDLQDSPKTERLWDSFGEDYFLRFTPDEVAWHTAAVLAHSEREKPLVLLRKGPGGTDVFVYTKDQDRVFATMTSAFSRLGLTIVDARILTTRDGMTLDSYVVVEDSGESISAEERRSEIRDRLHEQLSQPPGPMGVVKRMTRRQLKHFPIPTEVYFYPDASNQRTVMEVSARDQPGLLSHIAGALVGCGVRLQNAKIATFGERAEDIFYVTDANNRPLSEEAQQRLGRTVRSELEQHDSERSSS
jgi:[protein-PII] uridylyltransferase